MHFTGALNPGMSGGPAVSSEGLVVGVNVSKRTGGAELVSFLVPARFAAALLQRVRDEPPPYLPAHAGEGSINIPPPQAGEGKERVDFRAEIARQLAEWQAGLYKAFGDSGFRAIAFGPYRAPEAASPWFTCWAQTNAGVIPKPRASINAMDCRSDTSLFVASDLTTGSIQHRHSYVTTTDLNQFQFAAMLSRQSQPSVAGGGAFRKWYTAQRCHEDFVAAAAAKALPQGHPPLRVVWCAQAYREFEGLYDVALTTVTEDNGAEALVSRLTLQAVGFDAAVALSKRFIEAVQK
jgi:hypothetical protein